MSEQLARDVEKLAVLFKAGGWHEIRVETDSFSLLLSNDTATSPFGDPGVASVMPSRPMIAAVGEPVAVAIDPTWEAVTAPNLGTFYRSPKPGSAPFVKIGDRIESGIEVCLLEVMKLFTSVKTSVAGIVRQVGPNDGQLVETGQILFYIERDQ